MSAIIRWLLIPSLVALLAIASILSNKLERRDAALNIAWPRVPIPDHGRIVTIQHSPEEIERFVLRETNPSVHTRDSLLIAPQADIYYEAHIDDHCSKHFVILESTNSHTGSYHGLLDRMRSQGFCTLVFDWRSHGRSEDTPGDMTSELFMLDAAAIIEKVFPGQAVHLFGWSLGGFVGYQLAIYKPQLVKSLFVYGCTSCFAPIPEGQTECVDQWSFAKVFFSRGIIMRLIGLKAEARLGAIVAKFKTPFSHETQQYLYSLRMDQKVKTPRVWLQVQGAKTFSQLSKIVCPFQQLVGEHEGLVTGATQYSMELEASRISKAEPPILLKDPAGEGYSHFAIFEEGGMDLLVGHLKAFYDKFA
mmetsp:Transcript_24809/g.41066  ORF Transcript_24809/g.41066 Transcript_24809/m.41066 type:complete len:362 (+) Transcript_24809:39-1124(+)